MCPCLAEAAVQALHAQISKEEIPFPLGCSLLLLSGSNARRKLSLVLLLRTERFLPFSRSQQLLLSTSDKGRHREQQVVIEGLGSQLGEGGLGADQKLVVNLEQAHHQGPETRHD